MQKILEVYLRQDEHGQLVIMFKWPVGAREMLDRRSLKDTIGNALAGFGEQLRVEGLGLTKQKPATLYGADGKPVAY